MNRIVYDSKPADYTAEKKADKENQDESVEKPLPTISNCDNSATFDEYYTPTSKTDFTL